MGNIVSPDGITMMSGTSGNWASKYNGVLESNGNYTKYDGTYIYPEEKYYDKYSFGTDVELRSISKLGESTREAFHWYRDLKRVGYSKYPWFYRSGYYGDVYGAGLFYSWHTHGGSDTHLSTRIVISILDS